VIRGTWRHDHEEDTMRFRPFVVIAALLVLTAVVTLASESRTYQRPLESTWDEAIKAVRDADLVMIDSDRSEHRFTMRTKVWYSRKKGHAIEVQLSGDERATTVTARASDPEDEDIADKPIARYLEALDKRMD
jgi:hypothetical protein